MIKTQYVTNVDARSRTASGQFKNATDQSEKIKQETKEDRTSRLLEQQANNPTIQQR